MNNENLKPVQELTPFTKMIMTIGVLPTSFYSSMSYYESMVWLYEYLKNQVIPTVNNNAEAVEELQTAFITLKTWIENYFENLDVQEEINHKLDEMAEDGTITNLIKQYIDPIMNSYQESINSTVEDFTSSINTTVSVQNRKIGEIDTKVNQATSGSPLVATSTAEMTETDRVYVNTTDGYWYYYDGDSWEQGGIYQASVDNETTEKLVSDMYYLMINTDDYSVETNHYINALNGALVDDNNGVATSVIDISGRTSNDIKIKCSLNSAFGLAVYDKEMKYLTGICGNNASDYGYVAGTTPQDITFRVPNNAFYIRASMRSIYYSQKSDFNIQIADTNSIYAKIKFNEINLESYNMINLETITEDYRINPANGNLTSLNEWNATDFIKIEASNNYYFKAPNALGPLAYYDENYAFISGLDNIGVANKLILTTPENSKFIRLSIHDDQLSTAQLNKGKLETLYTPYKLQIPSDMLTPTFDIIVSPTDDLIEVLQQNQGKTILLREGTYNIEQIYKNHFDDNYFENYTGYDSGNEYTYGVGIGAGLPIFNRTKLVGTSGAKFVFNYTGTNPNVKLYFSCFATGDGITLDGINCNVSNVRYIVHDDYNISGLPYHTIIKNCRFNCNVAQCIGGGMGNFAVYEIFNNVFTGSYKENVSYHNKYSSLAINEMTIKDNYFETRLSLRHYGLSTQLSNVLVTNNNFGNPIELRKENPDVVNENINLIEWNNIVRNI